MSVCGWMAIMYVLIFEVKYPENWGIEFPIGSLCYRIQTKTAELSQRRPRDAPNIWVPSKFLRVLTTHLATYPEICNGLLFRSILRMCVQNLKFVALPVPGIIKGTQKIWAVPVYAHAPFSPKFLLGFCSHGPSEYICQIWHSYLYPFLR